MKRSSAIALTAMGAGTLAMVAVGNEVTRSSRFTYPTVAACSASGEFTEEQCREAESNAQGLVSKRARSYDTLAACQTACGTGSCTAEAPYTARMTGFAIGKSAMNGGVKFHGPVFAGSCVAASRNTSSRSSYYYGGGPWRSDSRAGRGSGTHTHSDPTTRSRGSTPPSSKSATTSRGGFGGSRSSGSSSGG